MSVPGRNTRGQFVKGNAMALRRPVAPADWDATRAALAAAAGGALPDPIRNVLVDEATHLTIACRAILGSCERGLLNRRGTARPQFATYLALVERLQRVATLLGLDEPKRSAADPVEALRAAVAAANARRLEGTRNLDAGPEGHTVRDDGDRA